MSDAPRDTLHGQPLPPPPLLPTLATNERDLRETVVEVMRPIRSMWDARSNDMLAVLAQSGESAMRVREAVRTIRLCAWCGVFGIVLVGVSVWQVLDHDRAELRKLRELDRIERQAASEELLHRLSRVCPR